MEIHRQSIPQESSSPGPKRYLPEGIIMEILSKLPAKHLLRFKTVSKSWYTLISTPLFVKTHLAYAAREHQEVIFEGGSGEGSKYISMNLQDKIVQPDLYLALEDLKVKSKTQELSYLSSCNGLLVFGDPMIVYNPVTRKFKVLPPLTDKEFDGSWITLVYDDSVNKYTVFAPDFHRTQGFFFTLGGDDSLWRELAESLFPFRSDKIYLIASNYLFVGCELHWVIKVYDHNEEDATEVESERYFFSLDVQKEKFKKTGLPIREDTLNQNISMSLSDLKGTICLTTVLRDELEIQKLEKNGSTCQWTTLYNIKLHAIPDKPDDLRKFLSRGRKTRSFCVPSCNSGNVLDLVKVFIHRGGKLFFYELKTNALHQIETVSSEKYFCGPYVFHVNSLVHWE